MFTLVAPIVLVLVVLAMLAVLAVLAVLALGACGNSGRVRGRRVLCFIIRDSSVAVVVAAIPVVHLQMLRFDHFHTSPAIVRSGPF